MKDSGNVRPFFSFVIPAHNMSGYIGRCLDSILTQPFGDVEAIVVDDASGDDTLQIVEEYAARDPRVRALSFDDNRSAHCARYDGVMASSGRYVWMVDGDDEISPEACGDLHDILEENPVDILHFGADVVNDGNLPEGRVDNMRRFVSPYDGSLEGRDILGKCFTEKAYRFNIWNKVFDGDLCRSGFESMAYKRLPKAQDEYEYFVLASRAGSYLGLPGRQYYVYHFGAGITGHNALTLEQFERYCSMAMTLDEILKFAGRELMSEEYASTLAGIEYQLFDDCYSNWMNNVPQDLKGAGLDLIMDYWGDSRAIGLIARKNWSNRGPIAKIAASSERMAVPGREVRTVATFYGKFRNGGIQRVMSGLMGLWTSMGYRVILITEEPPTDEDYPMPEGVVREVIPSAEVTTPENYRERSGILADILRRHSVDAMVYHAWVSNIMLWDMMTCKSCGVSFIVHCHNVFSMPVIRLLEYFSHLQPTVRLCDGVVVLSEADERYWSSFNGNVHRVVNPFSFDPSSVRQSDLDGSTVLWVGRMSDEKRPNDALKVMKEVLAEVPDARLVVVGGGSDAMMESLDRLASELGIRSSVSLEGFKTDVLPYYQQASVFLSTSEFEGYPTTFTESLSAGVPVVTYEMPYLTVARMGLGVVQVPRKDVKSAAMEVIRILRNDEYRKGLGDQARECVARLSAFDLADAWSSIFGSLSNAQIPKSAEDADAIMWSTLADHYLDGVQRSKSAVRKLTEESKAAEKKRAEEEKKRKRAEEERRKLEKKAQEEKKRLDGERRKADKRRIEASVSDSSAQREPSSQWNRTLVTVVIDVTGGYECTLDSIIRQTFRNWKCVAVAGFDPSPILARYDQYGVSSAGSVSEAVRSAKTPYVAVMSSSVELNPRFIGSALDRLAASPKDSIVFAPSDDSHPELPSLESIGGKVAVMKPGTMGLGNSSLVSTVLVSESTGIPAGASGCGGVERDPKVSFLLDCSECDPDAAEAFLMSVPDWGELVCFNAPAGDSFRKLKARWWDRRLTIMVSSEDRTPLCAVACCCDSPNLVIVDPSSFRYGEEFFDATLEAAGRIGHIVPDCPSIQETIGSAKAEGWALDPYSTIMRRSEVVANGFVDVSDACGAPAATIEEQGTHEVTDEEIGPGPFRVPAMMRVCPVCNRAFEHLLPSGDGKRSEAKCPACESLERHRAVDLLMRRTVNWKFKIPRVLYVNPLAGMAPYLEGRGIECMGFDEAVETTWTYDAIVLCHQLQKMADYDDVVRIMGSRLSEHGTLYITVPLKKCNGRTNMIEGLKIDVFDLMDVVSRHGMDSELFWVKDAFCLNTVRTRSLGNGAVVVCRPRNRFLRAVRLRHRTPPNISLI